MRDYILIIAGIIDLLANVPYIIDSLKGKTKPNTASWSTWTLINAITVVAAISAGQATNTVILGLSYFIGTLAIFLISIFKGTRRYTVFDGVCQFMAIAGVILWQISGSPNLALLFVIVSGEVAAMPTFKHAFHHPHERNYV